MVRMVQSALAGVKGEEIPGLRRGVPELGVKPIIAFSKIPALKRASRAPSVPNT